MAKCRDFRASVLKSFDKYMDRYFNTNGTTPISKMWKNLLNWLSLDSLNSNFDGNYQKYIMSLSKTEKKAKAQVIKVWTNVANVEEKYDKYFRSMKGDMQNLTSTFTKISSFLQSNNFNDTITVGRLFDDCYDEYISALDKKVYSILEKAPDQWTDGEYEIVAYAYLNSSDYFLKQQILNSFYVNKTDEYIKYENGKKPFGWNDVNLGCYEIDSESFDKFMSAYNCYFASQYDAYLKGECTDAEINICLKNYFMLKGLSEHEKDLIYTVNGNNPIEIGEDGKVSVKFAKAQTNNGISVNRYGVIMQALSPDDVYYESVYDSEIEINNGKNAETSLENKIQEGLIQDAHIDYIGIVSDAIVDSVDQLIPGFGKAVSQIEKTGKTLNAIWGTTDTSAYDMSDYATYVGMFDIKCCMVGGTYGLFPTPRTQDKINKFIEYLKNNPEYTNLYEKYNVGYNEYVNGKVDVNQLLQDLDGSGIDMNELNEYMCK